MNLRCIIIIVLVNELTSQVYGQYDIFQNFQSFLQPFQLVTTTAKPTRKQTNRQSNKNTESIIFFDRNDSKKETKNQNDRVTTSTVKPKKSRTTERPRTQNFFIDFMTPKNVSNHNRRVTNTAVTGNYKQKTKTTINPFAQNFKTTTANYWSTNRQTNQNDAIIFDGELNIRPTNDRYTSNNKETNSNNDKQNKNNPSKNNSGKHSRPGVRPAPVDESLPPITNRPVTSSPFPLDHGVTDSNVNVDTVVGPDEDKMSGVEKRRYAQMAEQMCEKYKTLNTKQLVALPLVPSPQGLEVNVSNCVPINIPLILGGVESTIEEFPHMALVGWTKIQLDGYAWKCGGSLISDQYVLTAGHCTYHEKDYNVISGPPQAVQLGATLIDGPRAVVVKVGTVILHPKYKVRRSYHDVALIKLVRKVTFSDVIKPACLGVTPPEGQKIVATGWGRTEFRGDQSVVLRSVSIKIWNMQECRNIWGTSLKLPDGPTADSQVCAGERGGGKDTCQGDSGGPVQIQDGCSWRVVGVTSVGRSCGAPQTPALYATIPIPFIAAQVFSKNINSRHQSTKVTRQQTSSDNDNTQSNKNNNNNDRYNNVYNRQGDGYNSDQTVPPKDFRNVDVYNTRGPTDTRNVNVHNIPAITRDSHQHNNDHSDRNQHNYYNNQQYDRTYTTESSFINNRNNHNYYNNNHRQDNFNIDVSDVYNSNRNNNNNYGNIRQDIVFRTENPWWNK